MLFRSNGLLDMLSGAIGTTPPAYLEGLLGQQAVEDLRKRSVGSGLVNALVGYAAMPKNQNLGLGRILAGAAQAGMQGAQNVYTGATEDYMMQQKVADMKRKVDLQNKVEGMIANLSPEEQVYARLAPEQYVANKAKAAKPTAKQLTEAEVNRLKDQGYKIPKGALVQADENGKLSLMEGTYQKEPTQFRVGEVQTINTPQGKQTIQYQADGTWKPTGTEPYFKPEPPDPFTPKMPPSLTPKVVTSQDVRDTAAATGKTEAQVRADLAVKKIKVQG